MTNDAAFNLHQYVRQPKRPGSTLTISGGKGGVGKTNLSVNLAIALVRQGKDVVVLDADIGLANVEVIVGLKSRETLQAVIEGRKGVMDILVDGPGGIKVAPGISGLGRLIDLDPASRRNVRMALDALQRNFDYVIVDTMAGIGRSTVAFAIAADKTLLVTTPEPSALLDAYCMLKMISALNPKAKAYIVVNMADSAQQAFQSASKLSRAARKYLGMQIGYAGHVPLDPYVRAAVLRSQPFSLCNPTSPAARAVHALAARITDGQDVQDAPLLEHRPGFFGRFAASLGIPV